MVVEKLWVRNDRFYAALTIPGKGTRRVPLKTPSGAKATTLKEARIALLKAEYDLSQGVLITGSATCPTVEAYVPVYTQHLTATRAKDQKTIDKEECHLARWIETSGKVKLDKLTLAHVNRHVEARSEQASNRTLNLDVIALGNLLRFAKDEGHISRVVTDDWTPRKHVAPPKLLLTSEQIMQFCAEGTRTEVDGSPAYKIGQLVADFVLLMAYTGARRTSCFALTWSDVDFTNRRVTFSKETKYDKVIVVDFSKPLEEILRKLHVRRGESQYVLPNPGNGQFDFSELYDTFHAIRAKLAIPEFTPHLLRHFFASSCIMSGVDLVTVASWLGHADRGVTLAKTYAHLLSSHTQAAAQKVNFGVTSTPDAPSGPSSQSAGIGDRTCG